MSRAARTALNAAANCGRFAANLGVLLLITPLIISELGTDEFGLWSLVFAVLGFLGLLDLGLQTSTVRYVAECRGSGDRARRNEMLTALGFSYMAVALVAALLLAGLATSFNSLFGIPTEQQSMAVSLVWILGMRVAVLGLPLGLFRSILFAEQHILVVSAVQAASAITYGIACWASLRLGHGLVGLAWVNLAVMLIENLFMAVLATRLVEGLRFSLRPPSAGTFREIIGFGGSQILVNAAMAVRLRSDPLVVKSFLSLSAVGVYVVAGKAAEYVHLLVKQAVNVLAPVAGELMGQEDEQGLRRLFLNTAKYALAPAVCVAVASYPFAGDALAAWIGPEFRNAGIVLAILLTATALSMVESTASSILAMTGHHRPAARAAAAGAVVNVVLSILLVRPLGLVGVALGTFSATLLVDAWIVPRIACRAYGISLREYVRQVVVPLGMPAGGQLLVSVATRAVLKPNSLLEVTLASLPGLVVFVTLFVTCALSKAERHRWLSIFRDAGHGLRPRRAGVQA